jgi:hypothetical protein
MRQRSNPAGSLDKMLRIPRISPLKNELNSPEHLSRTPGIDNFTSFNLNLDAKVTFYPGNRIDCYSFSHMISSLFLKKDFYLVCAIGYIST